MKTDKELGEIGAKAAYEETSVCAWWMAIAPQSNCYSEDVVKRTAFAKAVREAIFADCGEVPSENECVKIGLEKGYEGIRTACTAPLLKRISELENDLSRWQTMQKNQMVSIKELQSILSRIRALPEKWKQSTLSSSSMDKDEAIHDCANKLLAALGETEQQVDPYAELKAAHKAGKVIQCKLKLSGVWTDYKGDFTNLDSRYELRIKPWSLPPPPEGQQWHRTDGWTEEMLPEGYRPLLLGEFGLNEQFESFFKGKWITQKGNVIIQDNHSKNFLRTKCHLPPPPTFVPLEAKDVQVGWTVQEPTGCEWLITGKQENAIFFHEDWVEFSDIMDCKLSTDHGATWKPAKKLKQ